MENTVNEKEVVTLTIPGEQLAKGRFSIINRAGDILKHKHPDIDWDSNDLVITVVPKTGGKPEGA